jgi:hypothetical protein
MGLCSDNVSALSIYLIFLYININVNIVASLTVNLCAIFHYPYP